MSKFKDNFLNKRFIIFCTIGFINTLVYNIFYLLGLLFINYMISNIIAYLIAMTISFFLNCKYTFKVKPTVKKYIVFPLSGLATFITQTLGLLILVNVGFPKEFSGLIASLIAIPITFIVMKYILKKGDKKNEGKN